MNSWRRIQSSIAIAILFATTSLAEVWRGSTTDALSDKSGKNIKKLNTDVHKLFDHFPPQIDKGQV